MRYNVSGLLSDAVSEFKKLRSRYDQEVVRKRTGKIIAFQFIQFLKHQIFFAEIVLTLSKIGNELKHQAYEISNRLQEVYIKKSDVSQFVYFIFCKLSD